MTIICEQSTNQNFLIDYDKKINLRSVINNARLDTAVVATVCSFTHNSDVQQVSMVSLLAACAVLFLRLTRCLATTKSRITSWQITENRQRKWNWHSWGLSQTKYWIRTMLKFVLLTSGRTKLIRALKAGIISQLVRVKVLSQSIISNLWQISFSLWQCMGYQVYIKTLCLVSGPQWSSGCWSNLIYSTWSV